MRLNQIIEITKLLSNQSNMMIQTFIENYAESGPMDGAQDGIELFCRYYDESPETAAKLREVVNSK